MNKEKILFLILALLFTLISIPYVKPMVEGFSSLTPGMYPISSDVPILYDDYPLKKTMGVSNNTYADNYPNYPIFDSSYEQKTNNVRYWSSPNNGLCSPADFCNGIYTEGFKVFRAGKNGEMIEVLNLTNTPLELIKE